MTTTLSGVCQMDMRACRVFLPSSPPFARTACPGVWEREQTSLSRFQVYVNFTHSGAGELVGLYIQGRTDENEQVGYFRRTRRYLKLNETFRRITNTATNILSRRLVVGLYFSLVDLTRPELPRQICYFTYCCICSQDTTSR